MGIRLGLNKRFTVDSVITVLALIIIGICGLAINVIIQKQFNKDGLGIFSYVLSIFFILNSIGTLGMNRAMVYFSSFYNDNVFYRNRLITNALLLVIVWSSFLFFSLNIGLLLFSDHFLTENQATYLKIISFAIPFYCVNNVGIAILNGLRRMKAYCFLRSLRWVSLVFGLIILSLNQPLKIAFYSFILSELIVITFVSFLFLKAKYLTRIDNIRPIIEILKYIKYVYPSQILVSLIENIDIIIIEQFVSNASLGVYSFSSKVAKSLGLIGNAIQTNFNPVVSSYFKDNSIDKLKRFCSDLKKVSLKLFAMLILFLIVSYYLMLEFYLKDQGYANAFKYFILQSIATGIYAAFAWAGGIMIMTGKIKENIYRAIWKLIFIVCLVSSSVSLLPLDYGMYVGFTLVMVSQLFIDRIFISKYVGIKIF